jgi:hypothetical protein
VNKVEEEQSISFCLTTSIEYSDVLMMMDYENFKLWNGLKYSREQWVLIGQGDFLDEWDDYEYSKLNSMFLVGSKKEIENYLLKIINSFRINGHVEVTKKRGFTHLEIVTPHGERREVTLEVRKLCDNDRTLYADSPIIPVGQGKAFLFDGFSKATIGFPVIEDQLTQILLITDTIGEREEPLIQEEPQHHTVDIPSGYLVLASSTVGFNRTCARRYDEFEEQGLSTYYKLYDKEAQDILLIHVEPGTYRVRKRGEHEMRKLINQSVLEMKLDLDEAYHGYTIEKVSSI